MKSKASMKCFTHHMDTSRKESRGFDHLLLLLYLGLQLASTDLVLGEQDGGWELRLLLEKPKAFGIFRE